MSSKAISSRVFGTISLLLFIGTVIFLSVEMARIDRLEDEVNKEKVIAEGLLSEKLLTEKERDKLGSLLEDTKASNAQWRERFDSATSVVHTKQGEINQLNAALKRTANERALYKNFQLKNEELEQEISQLENMKDDLELTRILQDERISSLLEDNSTLRKQIDGAPPAIRQMLIETRKKNTKLTSVARRTQKIACTVQINETENLTCEIVNPTGAVMKTTFSTLFLTKDQDTVSILFTPDYKLKPGLYTVKILSRETLAGSLQVRLR